jgi:hypothetical protein
MSRLSALPEVVECVGSVLADVDLPVGIRDLVNDHHCDIRPAQSGPVNRRAGAHSRPMAFRAAGWARALDIRRRAIGVP